MSVMLILLAVAERFNCCGGAIMNSRALKKQVKYIVPEIRLALIREPGGKAVPIGCPDDLEQFIAPLKMLSEEHFVAYHLDCRNQVANVHVVSHGTASPLVWFTLARCSKLPCCPMRMQLLSRTIIPLDQ